MSSEDKGWLVQSREFGNSKIMKARWRWTRNAPSLRASLRREPSPWHRAGARAIQRCTWQFCWSRYCTSLSSCTKVVFCWKCLRIPWHDQSHIRRICGSQTNIRIRMAKHGLASVENMQTWPLNGHRQSWGLAPAAPRAITDRRCNAQHRPGVWLRSKPPKKAIGVTNFGTSDLMIWFQEVGTSAYKCMLYQSLVWQSFNIFQPGPVCSAPGSPYLEQAPPFGRRLKRLTSATAVN